MNRYFIMRKWQIAIRRIIARIRRFFKKLTREQKHYEKIAANKDAFDFNNFFYPQVIYVLTAKTGKNRAMMAPVKWITPICSTRPQVALSLIGGTMANAIKKTKAFTISMPSEEYARDVLNMIKLPATGTSYSGIDYAKVSRFRAEQAFFTNSYKVQGFPWVECKLDKFLKLPENTILITAEIVHISKNGMKLTDRILHFKDELFINAKRLAIKKVAKFYAGE